MEKSEKTIITSERANYKLISLIIALIGVVVFIIVWSNANLHTERSSAFQYGVVVKIPIHRSIMKPRFIIRIV